MVANTSAAGYKILETNDSNLSNPKQSLERASLIISFLTYTNPTIYEPKECNNAENPRWAAVTILELRLRL
jgi:hypothetical protein